MTPEERDRLVAEVRDMLPIHDRDCRAPRIIVPAVGEYLCDCSAAERIERVLAELEHLSLHVTACSCAAQCRETGCQQLSLEVSGDGRP